ncbi:MAG: hypothetical protein IJG80_07250 [Selenomonadaceae bacterium]|nr:hypothetical protein [Selenomonadaceae bacterium]MBQ3434251.1 hypothetical protein [Selenomonadaceae bacterium]
MTAAEWILARDRRRELRDIGFLDEEQFRMLGEVLRENRPKEMKVVNLDEWRKMRRQA